MVISDRVLTAGLADMMSKGDKTPNLAPKSVLKVASLLLLTGTLSSMLKFLDLRGAVKF